MKRILQLVTIFAVAAFMFAGCSGGSGDPKSVLKDFFEKLAKKDLEGAAKLATADSKSTLDMVKKGMDMAEKMKDSLPESDPMNEFKDVEFGDAKIDGNTATVTVTHKTKTDQPPADFTLVKEDGRWKVDFSMATLMKMGQQQMPQGATPPSFSPQEIEDSLHLRPEELQKAQQSVDSLMQHIDPKQLEELREQAEKLKSKQ